MTHVSKPSKGVEGDHKTPYIAKTVDFDHKMLCHFYDYYESNRLRFPKRRHTKIRMNVLFGNQYVVRRLLDEDEMIMVLDMYVNDEFKLLFLSDMKPMLYECYNQLVDSYDNLLSMDRTPLNVGEWDEEELEALGVLCHEYETDLDYESIYCLLNESKNSILNREYQRLFGGHDDFGVVEYYNDTCCGMQLYKAKRLYRELQETCLLEAFYALQLEAFMYCFRSKHPTVKSCYKPFLAQVEQCFYKSMSSVPLFVMAPYQFKDAEAFMNDKPVGVNYDELSNFDRLEYMMKTEYVGKLLSFTPVMKEPLRKQHAKACINIKFF